MKIFTKTNIAHKVLSIVLNFLLIFYSVAPGINASLVYAQEATSTATVEATPSPSVEPTPLPTPSPSPSVLPEASPEIIPSSSPSAEPSPTDQVENNSSPEPTVGQPNAPPAESPSPSLTPEPSPSAEVIQTAKGHLAATILENTNAQSLQLDLSTQGNVSSASLTTDKADYAPTDTAVITGSDFPKEAQLKLIITADNYRFEDKVTTDENGQFIYTYQLDGTYRPLYIVEAQDLSGLVLATTTFTDAPISGCISDSAGANDLPNQKDLSKMCVNYSGLPTNINVSWNWDDTSFNGNNTGDACSLYDTDGDGLANYSLCVGVTGNPAAWSYTKLYSCGDGRSDRCDQPTLLINNPTSTCSASIQGTDPFSAGDNYPNDTEANCNVYMSDVGGSTAALIDVCSYPAGPPNSDPADCILLRDRTGKLEVVKDLVPDSDTGLFNLQIDGQTEAPNVGDGGTTGEKIVSAGISNPINHIVGETAGTGTSLSDYSTSIICKDLNGTGSIVAQSANTGPLDVPILDEQDIVCTITNTQQNGTLIVRKVVTNDNGGTKVASDFSFQVNGGTATSFEADGQNDLTVSTGTYTITEPAVTGYTTTYDNCTNVVVPANGSATCTITNNDQGPTLTVIKEVTNNNGGTKAASDFTINVTGTNVSNTSFPGAGSPGTTVTLDPGSYSVSENADSGYNTIYSTDCSGIIALGENKTCTVTNDDKAATLIVKKVVTNNNGGTKAADDFSFSVNGASATAFEADGQNDLTVSAGTYNITEPAVAGYTTTYDNCSDVNIPNGGSATCTITNDDQSGTLIVKKVVTNDNGGNKVASDFSFQVNGAGGVPFEADGQNDLTVNAGTYNITEPAVTGYTTTYDNCSSVVVPNGGSETCTITNNDQPAHVIVIKNVTNSDNGTKTPSDFTMRINGTSVGVGVSFPGVSGLGTNTTVNAGNYTVTEDSVDGYSGSMSGDCSGSIANGETKTCTVTNDDQPANLIVIKHVVNDNGGGAAAASAFTMHINGTSVGVGVSFPGAESPGINTTVKAGSFAVTEDPVTGYSSSTSGDCSGTVANGETKTCTITNNDQSGTLIVKKVVVNDNGGILQKNDFSFSVNGADAVVFEADGQNDLTVNAGTYNVTEPQVTGYTTTYDNCSNLNIPNGGSQTCTITNNDQAGTLIVKKVVVNDNGGTKLAQEFSFKVNGGSAIAFESDGQNDLTVNAGTYSVTEPEVAGYDTTYDNCSSVVIPNGGSATCTVTNDDKVPSLTLNKVVVNNNGGTALVSDWSLYASMDSVGIGGTGPTVSSDSTFSAGTYILSEVGPSGYTPFAWVCVGGTQEGDQITLGLGQSATCTITNNDNPPSLTLDKIVVNDSGGTAVESAWTLTAEGPTTISGPGASGSTDVTSGSLFKQGTYTLSESGGPAGYSSSSWTCTNDVTVNDNNQITLGLGQSTACTITNDDIAPTLTLVKILPNDNGGTATQNDFNVYIDGQSSTWGQHTLSAGRHTASEDSLDGYIASVWGQDCNDDGSITLNPGDNKSCTITNDDQEATLTLVKVLPNDDGAQATQDDFNVYINGNQNSWGNHNLNAGSYTVSEDALPGYVPSAWGDDCDANGTIIIAPGDEKTCTITNDDVAPTLTLIKTVVTNDGGTATETDFQAYINNNPAPWNQAQTLSVGDYTASELANVSGYTPSEWTGDCDANGNVSLAEGDNKTCYITNDDVAPTLTLVKNLPNDNGGTATQDDFNVYINDEPVTWGQNTVNAGDFTVSEDTLTGYEPSVWGGDCDEDGNVILLPGDNKICEITNDDQPAHLILVKNLPNDNGGTATQDDFDVSIDGQEAVWDDNEVNAGFHTVDESILEGYTPSGWGQDCDESGNVTLLPGETKTCTITNDDIAPILTLVKTVINDNGGLSTQDDFNVYINSELSFWGEHTLSAGSYTVSEDTISGYTSSFWGADCAANGTITLNIGDEKTCSITNDDEPGKVSGKKFNDLNGNHTEDTEEPGLENWTITLDKQNDSNPPVCISGTIVGELCVTTTNSFGNYAFLGLEPGIYIVSEVTQPPAWLQTRPDAIYGGEGHQADGTYILTIGSGDEIDDRDFGNQGRGTINVHKNVDTDGDGDIDEENATNWTWDINQEGDFATGDSSQEVAAGTYTVSEDRKEGYHVTSVECNEQEYDASESIEVDVEPGQDLICTFTNTRDTGTIEVHKKVDDGSNTYQTGDSGANEIGFRWGLDGGEANRTMGSDAVVTTGDKHDIDENSIAGYVFTGWYEGEGSCANTELKDLPSLTVRKDETRSITLCNKLQNPILTITKSNDKTGIDMSPGGSVLYTLTVEATQSAVLDVKVIDLPPAGFKYRSGSFTAVSNLNPGLIVSEPVYASPGTWNLGNMAAGEIITLTYIADIDAATDSGLYKDLAWSKGKSLAQADVLANKSSSPEFFVGTEVNVVENIGESTGVEVEKKELGEVLGISTSLPATGVNTIWVVLAALLIAGGAGLMWQGMSLRRKYE